MKVYMTNGTLSFLMKLANKNQRIHFYFMHNESSTLAYYEGIKKKVFAAGREYTAIDHHGEIAESGFVMMDHIPVTSETQPIFENTLPQMRSSVIKAPGFQALRFLKPRRGNQYVIVTQWHTKGDYENWFENEQEPSIKSPAYFADKRFKTSYHMVEEEEEKEK